LTNPATWGAVLAATALVAITYSVVKALNAEKVALKSAQEGVQNAKTAYEEIKTAYDELKQSI
jgi:hypothetical protein